MSERSAARQAEVQSETTVRVTLLIRKSNGRVLFLEAEKDFVDTLVSFLVLPVGTIIRLLSEGAKVKSIGGISSIFESVEKLQDSLLYVDKKSLTDPRPPTSFRGPGLLQLQAPPPQENLVTTYYGCSRGTQSCRSISSVHGALCSKCNRLGNFEICTYSHVLSVDDSSTSQAVAAPVQKSISKVGYVKKNLTYIVTDNLEITTTSTIKSINFLNKMKVNSMSDLESRDISVGPTKILQLLQAALTSNTALNDVFG